MINTRLVYVSIVVFGLVLTLLALYPDFDISFSKIFYNNEQNFIYHNNGVIRFFFLVIPIITTILLFIIIIVLFYQIIHYRKIKYILLSWSFYIILTLTIGPGLIVNSILKENVGRARPVQIQNFSGTKNFTKACSISDQCKHNCSFPSGHAAMGYYFTSFAYIALPTYFLQIYCIALLFGSLVGFSRILMGGHFLSDVITSGFIILIINHILYLWWQKLKSM